MSSWRFDCENINVKMREQNCCECDRYGPDTMTNTALDAIASPSGKNAFCTLLAVGSCRGRLSKCRIRRLMVDFLENISSEDHQILFTYRGQSASHSCRIWRHQLLPVDIDRSYKNIMTENAASDDFCRILVACGGVLHATPIGGFLLSVASRRC